MSPAVRKLFAARDSGDRVAAYQAFVELMALTEKPVPWAYEVWDRMVGDLSHRDGHRRAFAAQMLAHLAISDPEGRMSRDFDTLAAVLNDDKTVTARHALQSIWRVGLAGEKGLARVLEALERRFHECGGEKNGALVRTDVVTSLGHLHAALGDDRVEARAEALMSSEEDPKAQKKQRACWRKAARG